MMKKSDISLFEKFPTLKDNIPFYRLGNYPTPLRRLDYVSDIFKSNIWLKDDSKTASQYGGNKIRKLEFLLADALKKKSRRILTLGGIGSNHIVATGIFANELGIRTEGFVYCQPSMRHVRENILIAAKHGIELHLGGSYVGMLKNIIMSYFTYCAVDGRQPYLIHPGGSSCLGVLGYVNAAIELFEQTYDNTHPKIDVIFVSAGTCGTVAGLILAKLLFHHTWKIIAVRVTPKSVANNRKILHLISSTYGLLKKHIEKLPRLSLPLISLIDHYYGKGYGHPLDNYHKIEELLTQDQVEIEPIYTGKTFTALQGYASDRSNENILFWNTYAGDRQINDIFSIEVSKKMQQFVTQSSDFCFCSRKLFNRKECPMLHSTNYQESKS